MTTKRFKSIAFTVSTLLFAAAAVGMFHMGWSWIYKGFGLHPFLSIPGGIAAILLPFAFMYVFDED